MANYDEDLFDNPFFVAVHKQYADLFNQGMAKKALLCVPKFSACTHKNITKQDAEDHILIPDEPVGEDENASEMKMETLSGKMVLISGGKLHTSKGFDLQQAVPVLFEETFHSENDNSYRVLCIGHFLSADSVHVESAHSPYKPSSYEQCLDMLWNHAGGQKTRDNLDRMMAAFADVYDTLEVENLRSVMDMASAHFTKAMQHLLKDSFVRQSAKHNSAYMESLKVAVETYMMHSVHVRLFRVVTAVVAAEDAEINKMTRNLSSLQLQDMGIRKIFSQNIPPARKELSTLNRFSTPLGRLFCIKRVVTALTRPLKQSGKTDNSTAMMTTDDFLPILIFLIIKSEIPNWMANLVYMRHFHFAKCTDDDEFGFYLASVEAALEHIKSGNISEDIKMTKPTRERWTFLDLTPTLSDSSDDSPVFQRHPSYSVIDEFFKCVQEGDEEAVKRMLQQPIRTSEELSIRLCHPLCFCDKCEKLLASCRSNSNLVTAYTRDNRGYTALHMAAYHGQAKLIDLLVHSGAVVNATDYLGLTPLHLACQRGYQNVMLLLLHFGADLMVKDNEGNTALHHCCRNGHEDCVKALVFYDTSSRKLQVNCTNDIGDTALHMAAKWGYENIIKILLENGADATVKNRKRQSPIHMAQNMKVQRLLLNAAEGLELQPVSAFHQSPSKVNSLLEKGTRTSGSSSGGRGRSGSSATNSEEDSTHSWIETASLDEVQDKQLKRRKDKLFKAIIDGDIQLVKFYLGLDEKSDDDEAPSRSKVLEDMCHPLCQCDRCISIQKARLKAHQSLSVNMRTTSGYTPLHMAVLHHHNDMVELFLQNGASINTQNHKNLTALHIAACLRNLFVVEKLLQRGAKTSVRDIKGDTPLHISCANGFVEGVQALIMKSNDVNLVNSRGNTPLHEAADHLQTGIIRLLLEAGADPTIRNKVTQTALNLAKDPQSEKVLQVAMTDWQRRLTDQRPPNSSGKAVVSSQVKIQELFAAFEEEDLKTLQSLTASIRSFHQQGRLRQAVTRDKSHRFLASMARSHSIKNFDLSTLRKVCSQDRSEPLYIYSLAAERKGKEEAADMAGTKTLVGSDSAEDLPTVDVGLDEEKKSLNLSTKEGRVSYCNRSISTEMREINYTENMHSEMETSAEETVLTTLCTQDLNCKLKNDGELKTVKSALDSSPSLVENVPSTFQKKEVFCLSSGETARSHQSPSSEDCVQTEEAAVWSKNMCDKSDLDEPCRALPVLQSSDASACRFDDTPEPDTVKKKNEQTSRNSLNMVLSSCELPQETLENCVLETDGTARVQPPDYSCLQVEAFDERCQTADDLSVEDAALCLLQHSLPCLSSPEAVPATEQSCNTGTSLVKIVEESKDLRTHPVYIPVESGLLLPVEQTCCEHTFLGEHEITSTTSEGQQLSPTNSNLTQDLEAEYEWQTDIVTSPCSDGQLLSPLVDSCTQDSALGNDMSSMLESEWEQSQSTAASRTDAAFFEESVDNDDCAGSNNSMSSSISDLFEADKDCRIPDQNNPGVSRDESEEC